MDAKLNPISSSTAGVPLSVDASTTQAKQASGNLDTNSSVIQDTLETSDREGDGRLPENNEAQNGSNRSPDSSENPKPSKSPSVEGQGRLLDLRG